MTIELVGQMKRKTTIVDEVNFLIAGKAKDFKLKIKELDVVEQTDNLIKTKYEENIPVNFHFCDTDDFGLTSLKMSADETFLKALKGIDW